jgi:hypothetical protein
MTARYANMLTAGADALDISAAMKEDGLSVIERSAAWSVIRPRTGPHPCAAPSRAHVARGAHQVPKPCKFQQAARLLVDKVHRSPAESFVATVARGLPSLSVKQKSWLKSLCDKNSVVLEYKPRTEASSRPQVKKPQFTNRNYTPYEEMDIPVWNEEGQFWYDAEY